MTARVAPSAVVEDGASVGDGTIVWDLVQIRTGARVGGDCVIGRSVFVDAGVVVGDRCKVQNNVLLYAPAHLGDGVFVGPGVVLTNDRFPRAVMPDGELKGADDWEPAGVTVRSGASLGAGTVVVGGVSIGAWAVTAAGAVVTRDVPAYALVAGVPARRVAWVGRAGRPLVEAGDGTLRCPVTDQSYAVVGEVLEER